MRGRPGLTLARAFGLTLLGITVLLGGLFSLLLRGWQTSIMESSQAFRDKENERLGDLVEGSVYRAQKSLENLERQIRLGACHADDALSVEKSLFAEILNEPDLSEVTLTHAVKQGFDEYLQLKVAPEERWQVSVFRETAAPESAVLTRFTYRDRRSFVADVRRRGKGGALLSAPVVRHGTATDPTEDLTFRTPTSSYEWQKAVWTDLHHSEMDAALPEAERRVVVTVMKAVEDAEGRFVGVLRVGMLTKEIDALVRRANEEKENEGHWIFICDEEGRLVTRGEPSDRLEEEPDTSLRVPAAGLPPPIEGALAHPALKGVSADHIRGSGDFTVFGRKFLLNFKGLGQTQGWRVGIMVPEDYYLGGLQRTRNRLLGAAVVALAVILLGGLLTVRSVRRGLAEIVGAAQRMRDFNFSPSETASPFRDVQDVMGSVELAKTALRAMGKYVPVDLVRHLYQTKREPILGGELLEVSLMFTDIKDFTILSERLPPNELAQTLGRYLEVMTAAIHSTEGVIDKYIGDAIMAVWNAPSPCAEHPFRACRAALACAKAARELYESPEWRGKPPLVTRFGLHRAEVMVGHFGAPDRMSYTALGDGVNLASRLEGLNKQYGTTILASEAIHERAKHAFAFRLLDVVAVKGKTRGVRVYELLGEAGETGPRIEAAGTYEKALEAYWARDFAGALSLLEVSDDDGPARVLRERCRTMLHDPPPADWDGIYVSKSK